MSSLRRRTNTTKSSSGDASSCPFQKPTTDEDVGKTMSVPTKSDESENVYAVPSRKPSFFEWLMQRFQIFTLQHPNGLLAWLILPWVKLHNLFKLKNPELRLAFGPNYCNKGNVVLTDWDVNVKVIAQMKQARTFQLWNPKKMPVFARDGQKDRTLFLLALSQKGAGGDGFHEALSGTFYQYLIADSLTRQKDSTAKAIISQLVEDYKTMPHGLDGEFFTSDDKGFHRTMLKYIHYCLFGISPSDEDKIDVLYAFHHGPPKQFGAMWYLKTLGDLINKKMGNTFDKLLNQVAKIYEESPTFAAMPESITEFKLTRNEVAHMVIPILTIAATLGPKTLLFSAMGKEPLPNAVDGVNTDKIDVCKIWDSLDLEDTAEVEKFIYEVGRLNPPVKDAHYIAREKFTVHMLGKDRTFPAGTEMMIPFNALMVDKNVWGETVYEFDHNRKNLVENSVIFNSVGNKTNGRICPGKEFSMNFMAEILVECGKARREMASKM